MQYSIDTELDAVALMGDDHQAESVEDELSIELSLEDVLNAAQAIGFVELRKEEVFTHVTKVTTCI